MKSEVTQAAQTCLGFPSDVILNLPGVLLCLPKIVTFIGINVEWANVNFRTELLC